MIRVVSDSSISISKADSISKGITVIPMSYTVNGSIMHELYSDTNGRFEEVLKSSYKCTTSQPSPSAFLSTFEELTRSGDEVLCLVISSRLSGTFSSALNAARESSGKVRVVDTRSTLGCMHILADRASELIKEGKDMETVAKTLEEERDKVCLAFSVESMDALRRSGRIGFVRQSIGTILNLRPVLLCENGTIVSKELAKGKIEQIKMLCAQVPADAKRIIIHYLGNSNVDALITALNEKFPNTPKMLCGAGPVIAINIGIPSIGVAWTI